MGNKCQATFYRSTVGIPIIPDDLYYVARVGMKTRTVMELQPATLFKLTSAKFKPHLVEMMKVNSPVGFGALKADKHAPKKSSSFSIITPALAKVIQQTNMIYADIFVDIIKNIQLGATPSAPPAITTTPSAPTATATST